MRERVLWLLRDTRRASQQGAVAIEQRQRARLAEMITFARANSPYYRRLYQDLPERIEDAALLPVTTKQELMAHFDDWGTDRDVTRARASAFVANPDFIGARFLGKYTVATTSGTTGTQGMFLIDDQAIAVRNALLLRAITTWLTVGDLMSIVMRGGRIALLIATGGHFAGAAGAIQSLRTGRWRRTKLVQIFPVHTPLSDLVAQLNQFRPVVVTGYASMLALLAGEQAARRLHIKPALIVVSAEGLLPDEYDRTATVFQANVGNVYAASECLHIAASCTHGWLHINSDWVVVEPVDADYRPTPPGEQSHTVLISNLANRVQPILRYDLGDSVLQRPDPCPCGNALPAIRVQGRAADLLTFPTNSGEQVMIAPLVFATLIDRIPGIELFQIVQTTPTSLRVRLRPAASTEPDHVWQVVQHEMVRLLTEHNLAHVTVDRATEPPAQSPGGKYRTIMPFGHGAEKESIT